MKPLALYVHVPFCVKKCDYCDFASYPHRETDWSLYFEALFREMERWTGETDFGLLKRRFHVRSLFIGGGTPTLIPAHYISEIIDRSRYISSFDKDVEITLEGNPGTLTMEKLSAYRRAGVNRLSMGAQSFDDGLLKSLGRVHSAEQVVEAVQMAREAGFSNINLDLMYGLPGQTMDRWRDTLERAIALDVQHISAYSLIVEDGTPMAARVSRGEALVPDDDTVNAMQRLAVERLQEADYGRYEISNFAHPGFECRHNLTYWRRGDYLGLGCAAHSLLDERRFSNPDGLDRYLAGIRMEDVEPLTQEDIAEETLMLSTRTVRGLDLAAWAARFGENFPTDGNAALRRLADAGLIEITEGQLRLTRDGMEVHNAVVLELLEIWEAKRR